MKGPEAEAWDSESSPWVVGFRSLIILLGL